MVRIKNKIRFKRGFIKPDKAKILRALKTIGFKKHYSKNDKLLENMVSCFKPLPEPQNNLDWLAQFSEIGQDCNEYLEMHPISNKKSIGDTKFIYYIQIGEFNNTKLNFNDLIEYSRCFFSEKSIKLIPSKIEIKLELKTVKNVCKYELSGSFESETKKLKCRYNEEFKKIQIDTQSLHELLKKIKPHDAICLIAFTEYDLYIEESDLFVAGLCKGPWGVGVFSCFRYDPRLIYSDEFWFDTRLKNNNKIKKSEKNLILARSCKLLVHETCHLLGIDHCVFMDCCMNGSGHLEEDFKQSMFLCPVDLKKVWICFEFDFVERYKKLKKFFQKNESNNEVKWLEDMIQYLNNTKTI